jgi:hypothetical protein
MRKHLIAPIPQSAPALNEGWLDLDGAAVVEVTSEEKKFRSSLRWYREKRGAGVLPLLALKPSG